MPQLAVSLILLCAAATPVLGADSPAKEQPRPPQNDAELRYWLENMVWHHRYSPDEVGSVTGLARTEVEAALKRFDIRRQTRPKRAAGAPLLVLPYPGGRHPRIGFLDGAVRPQRETKISVFTPWDESAYVVADVPEALWSNLGLTYLAHTHVPTIWSKRGVELDSLEWNRRRDGSLDVERKLPNGITFAVRIVPTPDAVRLTMTLTNGSREKLTGLRVQQCLMLKGAKDFAQQTKDNKVFAPPYTACRNEAADRWIVWAWDLCNRAWGNPPCPCLHSDPEFPDCAPGETQHLRGWLSFYEGRDIQAEFRRIEATKWRTQKDWPHLTERDRN